MKNFKEYLAESKRQWDFKIKIAGGVTNEQEETLKSLLSRYTLADKGSFKKTTTPIQSLPLDFPQIKNCEVNIYEVALDYPTTTQQLAEYISAELGVSKSHLVVRRPGEPSEEYQHDEPSTREGALLNDPDYKEAGSPQFEDYFGDKYNTGFVKELNDILKLQRKERGEEIPTTEAAKFNTDSPANTVSALRQAPDTRRK
jgi:hypothetical protein